MHDASRLSLHWCIVAFMHWVDFWPLHPGVHELTGDVRLDDLET
jgi:hypothetical protein